MKKRYTDKQIIKPIKNHEARAKIEDICRDLGIQNGTFYNWRSKFARMEVNEAKRLRALETENNRLKRFLTDKLLEVETISPLKGLPHDSKTSSAPSSTN